VLVHHSLVHDCGCCHDVCPNNVPWQAQSVTSASAFSDYDRLRFPLPDSHDHYSCNDYPTILWEHWVSVTSTAFAHCLNGLFVHYPTRSPWCWITNASVEASRLKIGSTYAYYWLAATVSLVLYGTIVVNWLRGAATKRDRRRHREVIFMAW
jgi:hypothetical protein